ncbi:hypothetical protein QM797_01210 [Rhodococcus sp. IEGM 1381]|uniref:hypothetical protein n=1 Tax=Rhodococcus sp. IEGM 1381 TaxID=3047085 RepID=UPI0024B7209A|nr:hypothetical protein [Rhodococcus sp. IEGM 1381]MDI9893332.1 hypothetical protein [Rhodococcus sp. IEGM 1381]
MQILRPDGAPSWRAATSDPLGLAVLLYIRDKLVIQHTAAPVLPPVYPTVQDKDSTPAGSRLTEQWNQRWAEATGPGGNADLGMESPTSPFFDSTPELRAAYEQHLEPAARWFAPLGRERAEQFMDERAQGLHDPVSEIVRDWQHMSGREPAPFTLTLHFAPVEGHGTWRTGDFKYIVAQNLPRNRGTFIEWLRPIIASAASGQLD